MTGSSASEELLGTDADFATALEAESWTVEAFTGSCFYQLFGAEKMKSRFSKEVRSARSDWKRFGFHNKFESLEARSIGGTVVSAACRSQRVLQTATASDAQTFGRRAPPLSEEHANFYVFVRSWSRFAVGLHFRRLRTA